MSNSIFIIAVLNIYVVLLPYRITNIYTHQGAICITTANWTLGRELICLHIQVNELTKPDKLRQTNNDISSMPHITSTRSIINAISQLMFVFSSLKT